MEWLLLALTILAAAVNIRSFYVMKGLRAERLRLQEQAEAARAHMAAFIRAVEEENEAFYEKLVAFTSRSAGTEDERFAALEEELAKLQRAETPEPAVVTPLAVVSEPEAGRVERVELMHRQGFSIAQIVKLSGIKRGEVELIVNLSRRKVAQESEVV